MGFQKTQDKMMKTFVKSFSSRLPNKLKFVFRISIASLDRLVRMKKNAQILVIIYFACNRQRKRIDASNPHKKFLISVPSLTIVVTRTAIIFTSGFLQQKTQKLCTLSLSRLQMIVKHIFPGKKLCKLYNINVDT